MKMIIKILQHRFIKWMLVVGCMLGIFAMSHLDSVKSWYMTGKVLTTIEQTTEETDDLEFSEEIEYYSAQEDEMLILRKIAHMVEFFILFLVLFNAFFKQAGIYKNMLISSLVAIMYAAFDEVHQLFVVGRTGSALDVLIDGSGILIGCLIIMGIFKFKRENKVLNQNIY